MLPHAFGPRRSGQSDKPAFRPCLHQSVNRLERLVAFIDDNQRELIHASNSVGQRLHCCHLNRRRGVRARVLGLHYANVPDAFPLKFINRLPYQGKPWHRKQNLVAFLAGVLDYLRRGQGLPEAGRSLQDHPLVTPSQRLAQALNSLDLMRAKLPALTAVMGQVKHHQTLFSG